MFEGQFISKLHVYDARLLISSSINLGVFATI